MTNQSFQVQGMSCGHCVASVENAVWAVDPQAQVRVDLPAGRVEVASSQARDALTAAIQAAGYRVVD